LGGRYKMIIVYITDQNGEGYSSVLTEVESWDELEIYTNHLGKDCKLTFEEKLKEDENE